MSDIFVSYSHENRTEAIQIVAAFEDAGFSVDWDNRLVAGDRYNQTLPWRVADAAQVVVVWSEHSRTSDWVLREAQIAARHRTIAPLSLDEFDPPEGFVGFHGLALRSSETLESALPGFVVSVGGQARRNAHASVKAAGDVWRAFHARRVGDFESATDHLLWAMRRFEMILDDPDALERRDAERFKRQTVRVLDAMSMTEYCGRLMPTLAGESLLPVIDAVLELRTERIRERLSHDGCVLASKYLRRKYIRTGVIIRPGSGVNDRELVDKLLSEASGRRGPLQIDCFLLIMGSSESSRGDAFQVAATRRGLDAKCIVWRPEDGDDDLENRLLSAAEKICEQPNG